MHREIINFLEQVRKRAGLGDQPRYRVVELGSYDLNPATGSARDVFQPVAREYVGVDHRAGPGVDVVSLAHAYAPARPFDVGVCCQVLEHDPYWPLTVIHLVWLVRSGGVVVVTCAGPGFPKHELDTSPGHDPLAPDPYYRNVSAPEVEQVLRAAARYVDLDIEVYATSERGTLDTLVWARVSVP